jgi:hypothetical protein
MSYQTLRPITVVFIVVAGIVGAACPRARKRSRSPAPASRTIPWNPA